MAHLWVPLLLAVLAGAFLWRPAEAAATLAFVARALGEVAPLVVPGVLISAWVNASGLGGRLAQGFEGHRALAIVAAAAIGAITPVCGVTVLPLMAGLLDLVFQGWCDFQSNRACGIMNDHIELSYFFSKCWVQRLN
jgi:uncharacterized membrane protein YraQ (UPF0718 family)